MSLDGFGVARFFAAAALLSAALAGTLAFFYDWRVPSAWLAASALWGLLSRLEAETVRRSRRCQRRLRNALSGVSGHSRHHRYHRLSDLRLQGPVVVSGLVEFRGPSRWR